MRERCAKRLAIVAMLASACWFMPGAAAGGSGVEARIADVAVQPQLRLGLAFPGRNPAYYHLMSDVGLGVVRIGLSWKWLEPRPGTFKWKSVDRQIVALQRLGIEPFLTLASDAPWGIRKETSKVQNGTPSNMETWGRFVAAVVERYDGDGDGDAPGLERPVRYFQVANEWIGPDNPSGGWAGTTDELIDFINTSHDAVKARSPKAIFVLGGIASTNLDVLVVYEGRANYVVQRRQSRTSSKTMTAKQIRTPKVAAVLRERVYPVLREARYDVADVHLYGPAERDPLRIEAIRQRIGGRPLISTECGGPSLNYQDRYNPEDHFMAVIEHNLAVLSEGLQFCLWLLLGENPNTHFPHSKIALFESKGEPKPGYRAYQLLAAILDGVDRVERRGPGHQYWLHRKGQTPLLVAWRGKTDANERAPLPPGVTKAHVLRVTDAVRGTYVIDTTPRSAPLPLSRLPIIAGEPLPEKVYPSR